MQFEDKLRAILHVSSLGTEQINVIRGALSSETKSLIESSNWNFDLYAELFERAYIECNGDANRFNQIILDEIHNPNHKI